MHGNLPKRFHDKLFSQLMGSTQGGTSIDGFVNGTLKFLNQNDCAMSWASELNIFPEKLDLWKCMGETLRKGNPSPILFVKLDTLLQR